MVTTEVRTPFSVSSVELSADSGLYRKQILEFRTIWYTDPRTGQRRKIVFDQDYGRDLIRAFQERAYDQVPFQLADADNRHTNDVTRTGGEVVAVQLSADGSGLDGILRLWGDGRRVIENNPKMGVSSRILEDLVKSDGRSFPRALQHVLATVDPQMTGMRPWEKVDSVELSTGSVSRFVDLSDSTYEGSTGMPGSKGGNGDGTTTLELSEARAARLQDLLDEDEALQELADQLVAMGVDLDDEDDEDELVDEFDDDEEDDVDANLIASTAEAVHLSTERYDELNGRVIELTNALSAQRTANALAEFERSGLSPAVLDVARPLLAVEPGAVELSNGIGTDNVDPAEVIRDVLRTVIELSNSGHLLTDLDDERGSLRGDPGRASERDALLESWENGNY